MTDWRGWRPSPAPYAYRYGGDDASRRWRMLSLFGALVGWGVIAAAYAISRVSSWPAESASSASVAAAAAASANAVTSGAAFMGLGDQLDEQLSEFLMRNHATPEPELQDREKLREIYQKQQAEHHQHHQPQQQIKGRRCFGDALDPIMEHMGEMDSADILESVRQNATCRTCSDSSRMLSFLYANPDTPEPTTDGIADGTAAQQQRSAFVILRQTDVRIDFVSVLAGMLMKGWSITALHLENEPNQTTTFREDVLAGVPCSFEKNSRSRFHAISVAVGPQPCNTAEGGGTPFQYCTLNQAYDDFHIVQTVWSRQWPKLLDQQQQEKQQQIPDLLLMDTNFVGGLLFAETVHVPTVTLSAYDALMTYVHNDPGWAPQEWNIITRAYRIMKQRFQSIVLTSAFMRLNWIRRDLQLDRIRVPFQYFQPVVATIAGFALPSDVPSPFVDHSHAGPDAHAGNLMHAATATISNTDAKANANSDSNSNTNSNSNSNGASLATSSIVTAASVSRTQQMVSMYNRDRSTVVHGVGPLQPPCIPCVNDSLASRHSSKRRQILKKPSLASVKPCILFVQPPTISLSTARNLIDGLTAARMTINNIDDCEWDPATCQNSAKYMQVYWIEHLGSQQIVDAEGSLTIPWFVEPEKSYNVIDAYLRRSPYVHAVVTVCDMESDILGLLGVPIVCISQSSSLPPREVITKGSDDVAKQLTEEFTVKLVHAIRNHSTASASVKPRSQADVPHDERSPMRGLLSALGLLETVADRQKAQHGAWSSHEDMVHAIQQTLAGVGGGRADGDEQLYDTFTVLVAWLVLAATILYIILKDHLHFKHSRRAGGHRSTTISDGIFARLPDLDDAWSLLRHWYDEQPPLRPDITFPSHILPDTSEKATASSNRHSSHVRRRKRR